MRIGRFLDKIYHISSAKPLALILALLGLLSLLFVLVLGASAILIRDIDPEKLSDAVRRLKQDSSGLIPGVIGGITVIVIVITVFAAFRNIIVGLQKESRDYARKISQRDATSSSTSEESGSSISIGMSGISARIGSSSSKLRSTIRELRDEIETLRQSAIPLDISTPDKVFQASRQRLLDEAVRLDSISRRNLIIGILFSIIALGVLSWPLVAAAFQSVDTAREFNVYTWAAQYYLPRFAVGVLLQFVGFFFLRLYVANEADLKHNKNEITNAEFKMMGVQLAQAFGDAASKKEIMKSLATTERNFIIRKSERTISNEASNEYNDVKGLIDKLVDRIPGKQK